MRRLSFLLLLSTAACGGQTADLNVPDAATSFDGSTSDASLEASPSDASLPPGKDAGVLYDAGVQEYTAVAQPGGLDHLFVQRKDVGRNLCFKVHLVHPSAAINPTFKVPQPWGLLNASVTPDAKACDGPSPVSAVYTASQIDGFVSFVPQSPSNPYPKTVDIDAVLTFKNAPAPIAPTEPMKATAIPVTGI